MILVKILAILTFIISLVIINLMQFITVINCIQEKDWFAMIFFILLHGWANFVITLLFFIFIGF